MTARPFEPSGWFALRAPLLGFEVLSGAGSISEVWRDIYRRPEVRDALFLASPKLAGRLDDALAGRSDVKAERALIRYLLRMCARPTPFGLFAGTSVGRVGDATSLELGPIADHRRRTRLDMHLLTALATELERRALRALRYEPNTSLYESGDRFRYAEAKLRGGRSYRLVAVEANWGVRRALETAQGGATFDAIAGSLVDEEVSFEDAAEFVEQLIASQLLVSDLAPLVTGSDALDAITDSLRRAAVADEEVARLEQIRVGLDKVDAGGPGAALETYEEIAEVAGSFGVEVDRSMLFQTDAVLAGPPLELGRAVVDEVARAVDVLARLTGAGSATASLARWRGAFLDRYDTREVSLVEALDEESGIGFEASGAPTAEASPLLAGLPFGAPPEESSPFGERASHILRKLIRSIERHEDLEITDADVNVLAPDDAVPLADAFAALVTVAAAPGSDIDAGEFKLHVNGVSGPSGARLVGRFCDADPALLAKVKEHLAAEEALRPGAVYAEVVHLPEGRTGNIVSRPVLRDHEIEFLGRSGAPHRIHVDDLTVAVEEDRIVLRSRSLGKEVIPRLSTAQNYTLRSLGIYRFLCALQAQNVLDGLQWRWGAFEAAPYLPRVTYGRIVLSKARWLILAPDTPELARGGDEAREAIRGLRSDLGLPRFVALADGDNELTVDLDDDACIDVLAAIVEKRPHFRLTEAWPAPDELCVTSPEGRHAHEILIPFVRTGEPKAAAEPRRIVPGSLKRTFAPGSEWLYGKLFCGTAAADELLRVVVAPLVAERTEPWFFLRYSDPDHCLRLRIHGVPEELLGDVLPALNRALEAVPHLTPRLEIGTYEREVERYGGPAAIEICERIFHADSAAAIAAIRALPGDAGMDARWRVALAGIDSLFDELGFDLDAKRRMTRRMRDAYAREFGAGVDLKRGLGDLYRRERGALEPLLGGEVPPGAPAAGLVALQLRSGTVRAAGAELRGLETAGELWAPLEAIATSLAHMHVNRMLRSAQRAQEYAIYDLLDRLYAARAARSRS